MWAPYIVGGKELTSRLWEKSSLSLGAISLVSVSFPVLSCLCYLRVQNHQQCEQPADPYRDPPITGTDMLGYWY